MPRRTAPALPAPPPAAPPPAPEVGAEPIHVRLKQARLRAGVTMAQMGVALGVSAQQVLKYERGQNRLCADRLPVWAMLCGTAATELLDGARRQALPPLAGEGLTSLIQAFTAIADPGARQALIEMAWTLALSDRQRRPRPAASFAAD